MATLPKSVAQSPPRIFYGWLIVGIAFCGSFIAAGTGGYIFGQLIRPLSQSFGWSVGFVSSVTLVRSLTSIVVVPIVGRLTDRIGSRPVMLAGSLLGGGTFLLLSLLDQPILFYILFSVVISLSYSMLGGIPSQAAVARWFRRRRGMAISLSTLGISVGGVVMVPLAQFLIDTLGWRFTFSVIGLSILLVMLPPVYLFMRDYPEQMGLQPDGETRDEHAPVTPQSVEEERTWTSRQVLAAPNFWKQAFGYMFAFAMLQVTLVLQFPFITNRGFDNTTAALIVSGYAFSAAVSRFIWGYLADRLDVKKIAVFSIWLAAVGVIVLIFAYDLPMLWLYALIGGMGIGGLAALQGVVTAVTFGRRSYGTVAGLLNPMNMLASAVAVPFAGYMFDLTHSYDFSFSLIVALAMLTSLSLLTLPSSR